MIQNFKIQNKDKNQNKEGENVKFFYNLEKN